MVARARGKVLRLELQRELEQPKTRLTVRRLRSASSPGAAIPKKRGTYPGPASPDRVQSVDLTVWTDDELAALQDWLSDELDARAERAAAELWEERSRTVVSTRYVNEGIRCGKEGCKCASGELHGPYWYAIETMGNGRTKRRYHGKKPPPAMARQRGFSFDKESKKGKQKR